MAQHWKNCSPIRPAVWSGTQSWLIDDVGLDPVVRLGLSGAGSTVTGHHSSLTTDARENTPVTDDEDREDPGVEVHEVTDAVNHLDDAILPDDVTVAHAVDDGARLERHEHGERDCSDPRKRQQTIRRPFAHVFLAPDVSSVETTIPRYTALIGRKRSRDHAH